MSSPSIAPIKANCHRGREGEREGGRERGREKPESFEEKKLEGGREREMDGWITGGMEGGSGGQHVGQGRISLLRIFTVLALNTIQRAEVDGGRGSDSRNLAAEN